MTLGLFHPLFLLYNSKRVEYNYVHYFRSGRVKQRDSAHIPSPGTCLLCPGDFDCWTCLK